MFGKKENTMEKNQELETIIGPSVKLKGNFNSRGNVRIEGVVKGSIDTKGSIKIGREAKAEANLKAQNIYIAGEVRGMIKAGDKIVLSSTAKIIGDLETKSLSIESGAIFTGKCLMTEKTEGKICPLASKEEKIEKKGTLDILNKGKENKLKGK